MGDAHPVLGLGVLDARLHGGDIVRLWNIPVSVSLAAGRRWLQQAVAFHLGKLTEESRGPLLHRIGPERRYRYRFINPLMRPFIFMKALEDQFVNLD